MADEQQTLFTVAPIDPDGVLSKKDKHINMLDELISCCLSTGKAPQLVKHEKGGIMRMRGQFHLYIAQPFGTHKSYLLYGVPEDKIYHMSEFTLPSITGTISDKGVMIESILTRAAGKTLVIDEAQFLSPQAIHALTELLEKQRAERAIGFSIQKPIIVRGQGANKDYLKMIYKKNEITIEKAVFSCLAMGLYGKHKRMTDQAFLSRFVYVPIRFTLEEFERLTNGLYERKARIKEITEWRPFDDYQKFHDLYWKKALELPFVKALEAQDQLGYVQRNLNDALRMVLYAECNNVKPLQDYEVTCAFFYSFLRNLLFSRLTETQMRIIDLLIQRPDLSQKEIAGMLFVAESHVTETKNEFSYLIPAEKK